MSLMFAGLKVSDVVDVRGSVLGVMSLWWEPCEGQDSARHGQQESVSREKGRSSGAVNW